MDSVVASTSIPNNAYVPSIPEMKSTSQLSPKIKSSASANVDVWTIIKILAIVIILAALGFNVFVYLDQGTDYLSKIVANIASYLPAGLAKTLNLTAKGTEVGSQIAAGAIADVGKIVGEVPKASLEKVKMGGENVMQNAVTQRLEKAVNENKNETAARTFQEDKSSGSSIQNLNPKSYCYVGSDRGYRSCVQIKNSTDCVSNQIFDRKDICENPTLRP